MVEGLRRRTVAADHTLAAAFQTYVASHLAEPIYNGSIARELGVSVRTLHTTVTNTLGLAPQRYIRTERLGAAHAALERSPSDTLVKVVARSCGFNHMGEFSQHYVLQFGELPSQTARIARQG